MLKDLKAWAAWPLWVKSLFVFGFAALTMVGAALPLTVVALWIAPYIGDLVAMIVVVAVLVFWLVYASIHNAIKQQQLRLQHIPEAGIPFHSFGLPARKFQIPDFQIPFPNRFRLWHHRLPRNGED